MIEFNPDGSIKLPDSMVSAKAKSEERMKTDKIVKISKEVLSFDAPKKCQLLIEISEAFPSTSFMDITYKQWSGYCRTPSSISKENERKFVVTIGTSFKRCSDCSSLIHRFDNHIVRNGNCPYY